MRKIIKIVIKQKKCKKLRYTFLDFNLHLHETRNKTPLYYTVFFYIFYSLLLTL